MVRALSAHGVPVRGVSRTGRGAPLAGVEYTRGDVTDRDQLHAICRDAAVLYSCVNVPYPQWARMLVPIAEAALGAAGAHGARLVVMDNLYMYGPPEGAMTETTSRAARGPKGQLRARLEQLYLDAHRQGKAQVAIGRASDFYGPGGNSVAMILALKPALGGKTASWLGSLDAPHTLNYLQDVGRALVTLGMRDDALGEIWHLPAAEPLTGREFIEMVFREVGRPPKMRVITRAMIRLAGVFSPLIRETSEVLYQFERPFVMDATKFERAFGKQVTPHRDAIRETMEVGN